MTELRLDWASYEAAKHAVTRWHYSRVMPSGKLARIGVWEDGRFIGVVIFGRGATPHLGTPYGLQQTECVELVRVALRDHVHPVTQIVAGAIRLLSATSPGLRLIVSFADPAQGHHGGIYQAGNWVYLGPADGPGAQLRFVVNGHVRHPRSLGSLYGDGGQSLPWLRENVDPNARRITVPAKHRYAMPLDRAMRRQLRPLAREYPPAVA